jgi:hypothetical protein
MCCVHGLHAFYHVTMEQDGACNALLAPILLPLVKRTVALLPRDCAKESDELNDRNLLFTAYFSFVEVLHAFGGVVLGTVCKAVTTPPLSLSLSLKQWSASVFFLSSCVVAAFDQRRRGSCAHFAKYGGACVARL